jgi:hypothetical protein
MVIETGIVNTGSVSGVGFFLYGNVESSCKRVLSQRNQTIGFAVVAPPETATEIHFTGEDITVTHTLSSELSGLAGRGLYIADNVTASVKRLLLDKNHEIGLFVVTTGTTGKSSFSGEDMTIINTMEEQVTGDGGAGVLLRDNVDVQFQRVLIDNNRDIGLALLMRYPDSGNRPVLHASNVMISNTQKRACFDDQEHPCSFKPGVPFGHGLGMYYGAEATLTNFVVSGNQDGIQLYKSSLFSSGVCSLAEEDSSICISLDSNKTAINAWEFPEDYNMHEALGSVLYTNNELNYSGDPQPIPVPDEPD